ncbi:amino acid/auxin permease-like protein [Phytophthora infestans T30-4]|uniref:Amino acid/auxin permease-like protein n=1 Tax=Phytophthora infestans (strain T30-4) TaxID=403677 RepID=D0P1R6_PHYIT|nr:amino acid/auxin permease-like protein [Phytophthora infestans T30-4]EEY54704.1 amino acid/auxin permease-like protein [Phytophthora infestans T30-4]|eukprot:XP_002895740.1 amino acid/auxin permease-like protein [Phytophthora infestans T30-4]
MALQVQQRRAATGCALVHEEIRAAPATGSSAAVSATFEHPLERYGSVSAVDRLQLHRYRVLFTMALESRQKAFLTMEDAKTIFNIVCCFFGIGTLSMPSNFARAGPVYGTIAMALMAFSNIYSTIALSRVMLVAPKSVKTFTDVGDWVFGKTGRYLVIVSQLLVCLLLPCAFLVLGSTLLDVLFPDSFSQIFWIVFMGHHCSAVVLDSDPEGGGV